MILGSDIRLGWWVGKPAEQEIRKRLTLTNPEWEERVKRGFSTWKTPKQLCFLNNDSHTLIMPRGFFLHVPRDLQQHDANYKLDHRRRTLPPIDFSFQGELRDYQVESTEAMVSRDFGTLVAPTGSGITKTRPLQTHRLPRMKKLTFQPFL